ncbi:uncharacterized protein CDAR_600771 [Caerostris darwini]|uniref:Uncharacterized protein n=1 Tax=Caerostris darwini TaxID=1538125 RepID=A0AAV4TU42_9ARAC|nr:uncharacterized protein CDAR_600771 [Caerostris darwini]
MEHVDSFLSRSESRIYLFLRKTGSIPFGRRLTFKRAHVLGSLYTPHPLSFQERVGGRISWRGGSRERFPLGYTPLHIAAMFGHEEIMEVLINTYGADSSMRDYSGKRPLHYLPKTQAERFITLFPSLSFPILLCGKTAAGKGDKEPSLMRMGSLNSKVKKPSVLSASGRAITRMKSWGSADNIPDRAMNLMPPPKTFPKKKKSRKHTDIIGLSENWRGRTPDSDSDSATGLAS